MKHHLVTTVDSLTAKTITFNVYGELSKIMIEGKWVNCIINQFGTPVYIYTINTVKVN